MVEQGLKKQGVEKEVAAGLQTYIYMYYHVLIYYTAADLVKRLLVSP